MCTASAPSAPPPPPRVPEAPRAPEVSAATSAQRFAGRSRAPTGGVGGTILTGPRGVTAPGATATKTLLGQ